MSLKPGLYIVSTPIGNLDDITLRGIKTLQSADYVYAEDTRVAKKLLDKHQIKTGILRKYNDFSDQKVREQIQGLIEYNKVVCLVSDAGTPLIADPGYKLVKYLREKECNVDIAPGVSSPIAALTISSLPSDRFMFVGFAPKTKIAKQKFLHEISGIKATLIMFDVVDRLPDTLTAISNEMGDRTVSLVRELTKMYQEVFTGSVSDLLDMCNSRKIKGELVLLVSGYCNEQDTLDDNVIIEMIEDGMKTKDIVNLILENHNNLNKSNIYKHIIMLKEQRMKNITLLNME